jgi:toxin-antitoxin system PIN domain toxin
MILTDVNILLYAYRGDAQNHTDYRQWLEAQINSDGPFGISEFVLSAFLRIATHPRIFNPPTPLSLALEFAERLRSQPNCVLIAPGARHWEIFLRLCRETNAQGNLIPDAYLAALAIESGCELITNDQDFSRFTGLRWRRPF